MGLTHHFSPIMSAKSLPTGRHSPLPERSASRDGGKSIGPARRLLPILILSTLCSAPMAADFYRAPVAPAAHKDDSNLSCAQLDKEIRALLPLTYSYRPGFFENPYQGAAITLGTTVASPFLLFPVYDYYLGYREQKRIIPSENRIEWLRYQKAEKHCFES